MEIRGKSVKEKIVDNEVLRRNRAEGAVAIRKARKDEILMKKREVDLNVDDLLGASQCVIPAKEMIDKCFIEWDSGCFEKEYSTARMAYSLLRSTEFCPQMISRMAFCAPLLCRLTDSILMGDEDSKAEAAKMFDAIIADNSEYIENLEHVGAIDAMIVTIGQTTNVRVARYCVSAMGNYMGDSCARKVHAIRKGIISNLVSLLRRFSRNELPVMTVLSWSFVNACRDFKSDTTTDSLMVYECLAAIQYLILIEDDKILSHSCAVLELLTGQDCFIATNGIEKVIQSGVGARLINLLEHKNNCVAERALNVIGNILYSGEEETQILVDFGVVRPLVRLLQTENNSIIAETLWSLSNISAGTPAQIMEVVEAGTVVEAVRILKTSLPVSTRKEAAWILTHIARTKDMNIIKQLYLAGALQALCYVLSTVDRDPSTVLVGLRGISRLLRRADESGKNDLEHFTQTIESFGGKRIIEIYLYHENKEISDYAADIMDDYFP